MLSVKQGFGISSAPQESKPRLNLRDAVSPPKSKHLKSRHSRDFCHCPSSLSRAILSVSEGQAVMRISQAAVIW